MGKKIEHGRLGQKVVGPLPLPLASMLPLPAPATGGSQVLKARPAKVNG